MKCIYQIRNLENGKIYVGSTKDFNKRKVTHLTSLKYKRHHNIYLQRVYNKNNNIFIFEILEKIENDEDLFKKEEFWIEKLSPEYNIGGVGGGDNYTNHPNKEILHERLAKQLRECKRPGPKFRDENPNWRGGRTFFTCPICGGESRMTGAVIPKTCRKCRNRTGEKNPFSGKQHSEETKKILREQRAGISLEQFSKKCSIDGVIYKSCTEASQKLGMKTSTVSKRMRSNTKRFQNYYYLGSEKDPNFQKND